MSFKRAPLCAIPSFFQLLKTPFYKNIYFKRIHKSITSLFIYRVYPQENAFKKFIIRNMCMY